MSKLASPQDPIPMLERIEAAMVARLKDQLPQSVSQVEPLPDSWENFEFPADHQASVLVHYERSSFTSADEMTRRSSHRLVTYRVILLARRFRGDGGSYALLDAIRLALSSQIFCGATPLEPVDEQLDEASEGLWRWVLSYRCTLPVLGRRTSPIAPVIRPSTPLGART